MLSISSNKKKSQPPQKLEKCDFSGVPPIELGLVKLEDDVSYKCLVCDNDFMHYSTAKRHYNEIHVEGVQQHECYLCGRNYARKRHLNEHLVKVHHMSQKERLRQNFELSTSNA
jgi:uncharacterized Zn-finger protein